MSRDYNTDEFAAKITIPVKVVRGKISYFYKGRLPHFEEGAVGDLIMPAYSVKDADWLEPIVASQTVVLLPKNTELLMAANRQRVPRELLDETTTLTAGDFGHYKDEVRNQFIQVVVADEVKLMLRGTKKAILLDCRCEIAALLLTANSLNHAYSLISTKYEPTRLAHTGNVFEKVYYKDKQTGKWWKLNHLRGIEEAKYEQERLINPRRGRKNAAVPVELSLFDQDPR